MIDASRVHTTDTAAVTVTGIRGVPNFDNHADVVISATESDLHTNVVIGGKPNLNVEERYHVMAFHMALECLTYIVLVHPKGHPWFHHQPKLTNTLPTG